MLAPLGVVIIPAEWVRCVVTNVGPTLVQILPDVIGGEVGQVRSRVEVFEQIRRDWRLEQLSIRDAVEGRGDRGGTNGGPLLRYIRCSGAS
jgi:hypothetical protein